CSFFLTAPSRPDSYPLSLHDALPIWTVADLFAGESLGTSLLMVTGALIVRAGVAWAGAVAADRAAIGVKTELRHDLLDAVLDPRSEEHTSELQSRFDLVCRLLLEKKK